MRKSIKKLNKNQINIYETKKNNRRKNIKNITKWRKKFKKHKDN